MLKFVRLFVLGSTGVHSSTVGLVATRSRVLSAYLTAAIVFLDIFFFAKKSLICEKILDLRRCDFSEVFQVVKKKTMAGNKTLRLVIKHFVRYLV